MKSVVNMKRGASIIGLSMLVIATIVVLTIAVFSFDNSHNMLKDSENEFKSSLIAYVDELELYIEGEKKNEKGKFKMEDLNIYGSDLRNVIPYIKEADMTKIEIKEGKIVYIGNDALEEKWANEILQSDKEN